MRTAKTLIRLGGCPGWSESYWAHKPFCWFCHEAAHFFRPKAFCRTSRFQHFTRPGTSDIFVFPWAPKTAFNSFITLMFSPHFFFYRWSGQVNQRTRNNTQSDIQYSKNWRNKKFFVQKPRKLRDFTSDVHFDLLVQIIITPIFTWI